MLFSSIVKSDKPRKTIFSGVQKETETGFELLYEENTPNSVLVSKWKVTTTIMANI